MSPFQVAALWRYPVKSLAGERLVAATVTAGGLAGDRLVVVRGPEGIRTARRHHRLLGLAATLGPDGEPLVDGLPWRDPAVLERVRRAAGSDAWLEASTEAERFDVLPLLVATDGAIAAFGRDVRRLRPNVVIGGVTGLAERRWVGRVLASGPVRIALASLRARCPMTTVDPDDLSRDPGVLLDIGRRFQGRLALDAAVAAPGRLEVGAAVELIPE